MSHLISPAVFDVLSHLGAVPFGQLREQVVLRLAVELSEEADPDGLVRHVLLDLIREGRLSLAPGRLVVRRRIDG